jgi:hypothetical protein
MDIVPVTEVVRRPSHMDACLKAGSLTHQALGAIPPSAIVEEEPQIAHRLRDRDLCEILRSAGRPCRNAEEGLRGQRGLRPFRKPEDAIAWL